VIQLRPIDFTVCLQKFCVSFLFSILSFVTWRIDLKLRKAPKFKVETWAGYRASIYECRGTTGCTSSLENLNLWQNLYYTWSYIKNCTNITSAMYKKSGPVVRNYSNTQRMHNAKLCNPFTRSRINFCCYKYLQVDNWISHVNNLILPIKYITLATN